MEILEIVSREREEMIDFTQLVKKRIAAHDWKDGAILLFCLHTTCGLTINEGADPDVRLDLISFFREIAPKNHGWRHGEGNTDAHIRASLLDSSLMIPVNSGCLMLGHWQSVYLYEGDGPRTRAVTLQFLKE